MAELKAHSTAPEAILSPEEGKLREEYDENRLESLTDLAIAEVDKTTTNNGLEGFFEEFLYLDADGKLDHVESPDQLVSNTVNRVMGILDSAGKKVEPLKTNNSNSSAIDKILWRSRRTNVLGQIRECRSEGETSLSVLAGHEIFLEEAKKKVASEYDEQRARVAEAYDGEGRFKKFCTNVVKSRWGSLGATALAGGVAGSLAFASGGISIPLTAASGAAIGYIGKKIGNGEYSFFGHRANITRERKLEKLDSEFKKKLQERYDRINAASSRIKEKEGASITRMQSKIDRKFKAAVDSKDKQHLWSQVKAVMASTGDASSLNLGLFGIASEPDKVLFLEALKNMPNILEGIENRKISAEKHQLQENVVEGARSQQTYIENVSNFSFESLQSHLLGRNVPVASTEVQTSDLISQLSDDLEAQGVHLEEDVYGASAKTFRGLMTDTTRLVMLCAYLDANVSKLEGCSANTQSNVLKWIEDQDETTAGPGYEGYKIEDQRVVESQWSDYKKEIAPDVKNLMKDVQSFIRQDVSKRKTATLDNYPDITDKIIIFYDKYQRVSLDFLEKDKTIFDSAWKSVLNIREYVVPLVQSLKNEQNKWNSWEKERKNIYKAREDSRKSLMDFAEKAAQPWAGDTERKQHLVALKSEQGLSARYDSYLEREPKFSTYDFARMSLELGKIGSFVGSKFSDHFTRSETISIPPLNQRIQRSLHKEFQQQLEGQCLKNLKEHDQFERIKELPMGSTVEIDFREISGVTHLRLPNQLEGSLSGRFRVVRGDENQVILENDDYTMTLTGPCSDGTNPFKNAQMRKKLGTPDSGNWAIAYNYKII